MDSPFTTLNLLRGIFREMGLEAPAATVAFLHSAHELVERPEVAALRGKLQIVLAEINLYEQCMTECEQQLARWHADDAIVRRLDEVSGIGVLTASALKTAVGQPERFASGRQLSAWLGMTPREFSSGNRRKLGHISRQGNVYVRTLLIHGSRAALLAAQRCQANTPVLSRSPWSVKKPELLKYSQPGLSRELHDLEEWAEREIMARGQELAEVACGVWPYPVGAQDA